MVGEHLGDDWTFAHAATVPEVSLLPGLSPLHLTVLLSGLFPLHLTVPLPHLASATVGLQRRACFGWADWTVAAMSKQNLTHHPGLVPEQHKATSFSHACEAEYKRADAKGRYEGHMHKGGRLSVPPLH